MIFYRRTFRTLASRAETAVSLTCVVILLAIGAWFASRGGQGDPDLFRLNERLLAGAGTAPQIYRRLPLNLASEPMQADTVTAALSAPPAGLTLDGRVESFGPENLYEKIDGRESLYKTYAFRRLWTATYAAAGGRMDAEVFQHGSGADALGVLSTERQGLAGARHEPDRTTTPNGIFRAAGAFYIRVFGVSDSPQVRATARQLSEHIAAALVPGAGGASARSLPASGAPGPGMIDTSATGDARGRGAHLREILAVPEQWTVARNPLILLGADPASIEFTPQDGLGVAAFGRLYLGVLADGGDRVKTFLLAKADPAAARVAVEAYRKQIAPTGKTIALPWPAARPPHLTAIEVELLGTVEAAVPVGRFVVGVTEAAKPELAGRVLARAAAALQDAAPERKVTR